MFFIEILNFIADAQTVSVVIVDDATLFDDIFTYEYHEQTTTLAPGATDIRSLFIGDWSTLYSIIIMGAIRRGG